MAVVMLLPVMKRHALLGDAHRQLVVAVVRTLEELALRVLVPQGASAGLASGGDEREQESNGHELLHLCSHGVVDRSEINVVDRCCGGSMPSEALTALIYSVGEGRRWLCDWYDLAESEASGHALWQDRLSEVA